MAIKLVKGSGDNETPTELYTDSNGRPTVKLPSNNVKKIPYVDEVNLKSNFLGMFYGQQDITCRVGSETTPYILSVKFIVEKYHSGDGSEYSRLVLTDIDIKQEGNLYSQSSSIEKSFYYRGQLKIMADNNEVQYQVPELKEISSSQTGAYTFSVYIHGWWGDDGPYSSTRWHQSCTISVGSGVIFSDIV